MASAWPQPAGRSLVIAKYEREDGRLNLDTGGLFRTGARISDETVWLTAEHGVNGWLTGVLRTGFTRGDDSYSRFSGIATTSVGLSANVFNHAGWVASVYAGAVVPGGGRNTEYGKARQGNGDAEVKVMLGRSWGRDRFIDLSLGHLSRSGLPDETRFDTALGYPAPLGFQLVLQSYSGRAESPGSSVWWIKQDAVLQRSWRGWTVQGGWRSTLAGQGITATSGPVVALWRRM